MILPSSTYHYDLQLELSIWGGNNIMIIIVGSLFIYTQMIEIYFYYQFTLKSQDLGSIIFLLTFDNIFACFWCLY